MSKTLTVLLALTLHSNLAFADSEDEIGICRYDLVGPTVMQDTIHEKNKMTLADCKKVALAMLRLNQESYDNVIIRYSNHSKPIIISIKDSK